MNDPSSAEEWLARSTALAAIGRQEDAEDAFWRAVDLRPSLIRPRLARLLDGETFNADALVRQASEAASWRRNLYIPSPTAISVAPEQPFMLHSTCAAADFLHPEFDRLVRMMGRTTVFHRKLWEWVYVLHHLFRTNAVAPGRRGLVFGVGQEMLPAILAAHGARITATDAPESIGEEWRGSSEFASGLAAMPEGPLPRETFEELVSWEACDMTAIGDHLTGFDFCWSSCCFEHLGSLRAGMDFVINSVEHCLRPGGVAVHTTEFNLSSNEHTVATGETVLYRRCDLDQLCAELTDLGHDVTPIHVAPDTLAVDGFVDVPPYAGPHLKLLLEGYVTTSVGLIIRKRSE